MDETLQVLAERLIAHGRRHRRDLIEAELKRRELIAIRDDTAKYRIYAQDQTGACVRELDYRADLIWRSYVRVISEARLPWTSDARERVIAHATMVVADDADDLDNLLRAVLEMHGHSITLPVRGAAGFTIDRVEIELDLFGLQYSPRMSSLGEQLSAPRYASPRAHWEKATRFLATEPPDYPNAVKEAISMVEAVAKLVAKQPSKTLGGCINHLRATGVIDPLLEKCLDSQWALANQEPGVRHGHLAPTDIDERRARYAFEIAESAAKLLLGYDK